MFVGATVFMIVIVVNAPVVLFYYVDGDMVILSMQMAMAWSLLAVGYAYLEGTTNFASD